MIGHGEDKHTGACLKELKDKTTLLKILGSYPKAEGRL